MATHLLPPPRDHDDDGLDQLLAQTAPPVAAGDDVDAGVQALLQATRPGAVTPISGGRRRRLVTRLALGAGAVALAASGASMAAANDDSPQSFQKETAGWTLSSITSHLAPGRCAAVGYDLDPDRDSPDDPAYRAAVAYLSSLHVEDIDPTASLQKVRARMVTQVDGNGNEVRTVPATTIWTDVEMLPDAYDDAVYTMLEQHLASQGMSIGTWSGGSVARLCTAPAPAVEPTR